MLNKYELDQHVVNLRFADVFNFFTINTRYFDDEPNSETSTQHTNAESTSHLQILKKWHPSFLRRSSNKL